VFLLVLGRIQAVIDDRQGGIYARPERIRAIDHVGAHYSVAGPLNLPRSPQGRPVLVQAGSYLASAGAVDTRLTWGGLRTLFGGEGLFLLDGRDLPMRAGDLLVAPEGIAHGIRNTGHGRLLVLAILAPAPAS